MSVIVTAPGILYERRDTTDNWNYVNPILGNKEKGFEVNSSGVPVGMKMGDGIKHWSELDYWFDSGKPIVGPIIVVAGTAMPIVVTFTYGQMPIVDVKIRGASNMFETGSATYQLYYSDPGTCLDLIQVWIYGNDDGSGNLAEDIMYSIVGNV